MPFTHFVNVTSSSFPCISTFLRTRFSYLIFLSLPFLLFSPFVSYFVFLCLVYIILFFTQLFSRSQNYCYCIFTSSFISGDSKGAKEKLFIVVKPVFTSRAG